jgi:hypothetical protein
MTYSYTQISQYIACPRRYRYIYLEGWEEKETRAAMLFGRAFEKALAASFLGQDSHEILNSEWTATRKIPCEYRNDTWAHMLEQGHMLLEIFRKHNRVQVPDPVRHLQVQVLRPLYDNNDFVGYIDALGTLDGAPCLLDWKVTSRCYPSTPAEIAQLDPQLVCYSWLTGIPHVALVVFVRKRNPEVQYLQASISGTQRQMFESLVMETVNQIERAQFQQHSGIRFPQEQCLCCAFSGLCLQDSVLVASRLTRNEESDLGWLDELCY